MSNKKSTPFWYDKGFVLTLILIGAAVALILTGHLKITPELLALLPGMTGGYLAGRRGWFQAGSPADRKEVEKAEDDKGSEKSSEEKSEKKEEEIPPAS